jgi:predicted PurR-regulated permease PerM
VVGIKELDVMEVELRTGRIWLLFAVGVGLLICAWFIPSLLQVFLVIFAGMLFGNFLTQLSSRVARLANLRYGAGYTIVIVLLLLLVGGTLYYMGSRIADQITKLLEQLNQASSEVESQLGSQSWWQQLGRLGPEGQPAWAANKAVSTATSAAWSTVSVLGGVLMIAFLGFYFALQPNVYREGFIALFKRQARKSARSVIDQSATRLWRWILGRLVGMMVIGVASSVGLWLLGIPLPVTLGVLAGLLNFVPNIGPIIAGIPAVLFGLQQGTNVALYVLVFYFLLQFAESYFLTPLIDQHQVSIPPGLMLSAQLLLGMLAGFLGLLLATPLTVLTVILVNELHVGKEPE